MKVTGDTLEIHKKFLKPYDLKAALANKAIEAQVEQNVANDLFRKNSELNERMAIMTYKTIQLDGRLYTYKATLDGTDFWTADSNFGWKHALIHRNGIVEHGQYSPRDKKVT